jgi:hypothetical protein
MGGLIDKLIADRKKTKDLLDSVWKIQAGKN